MTSTKKSNSKFPLVLAAVLGCSGCGCLSFIVITLLSAIALPTFLVQVREARQELMVETLKETLSAQREYWRQQSQFATSTDELGITFPDGPAYTLEPTIVDEREFRLTATAEAESSSLSFSGYLQIREDSSGNIIICQTTEPSSVPPGPPVPNASDSTRRSCSEGSEEVFQVNN